MLMNSSVSIWVTPVEYLNTGLTQQMPEYDEMQTGGIRVRSYVARTFTELYRGSEKVHGDAVSWVEIGRAHV